ncbi:Rid family detoxifying hydrolase [Haloferax profundi]|uniref:Reactive intermediate/imine deaminase n=1 Tax=Haloferax profundi TaxID=1544718 RepID=A0A0W1S988_9EURY|nr:Rid family detoxifying hydrolase [Haloferax profundi]KTG22596.1 reactive intermediate/imine deaminase [Haloferax profundi]
MVQTIETGDAPAAVGAYSQATTNGDLVFTAGQIPATGDGELKSDASIQEQTEQVLENISAVLASEGLSMSDVLKTTVYLDDINDFDVMNEVYASFFDESPPARSAFEAGALPKSVGIEIEAVAQK